MRFFRAVGRGTRHGRGVEGGTRQGRARITRRVVMCWLMLAIAGVGVLKATQFAHLSDDLLLETYGLVAGSYILSRLPLLSAIAVPGIMGSSRGWRL